MHILARLEGRDPLLGHRDLFTIARVAPSARVTLLDREHPKAAQLHPIPSRQGGRDRAQDRIDDDLSVPPVQVGFCSAILSISSDLSIDTSAKKGAL